MQVANISYFNCFNDGESETVIKVVVLLGIVKIINFACKKLENLGIDPSTYLLHAKQALYHLS